MTAAAAAVTIAAVAAAVVSAVAASEKLLAEMYEGTLDYWSGCPQDLPVLAATSQTKQRKRSTV